jgi:predicted MarR family transcription regulator
MLAETCDEIGLGDDISQLRRKRANLGRIVDIALQDREFVAAKTRGDVSSADYALDARSDLPQQRIADCVAERVVDVLKAIEIEIQHGKRPGAQATRGKCDVKPIYECPAVRQ